MAQGSCTIFPADNAWNTDISSYSVHSNSQNFINSILAKRTNLHPDFGANWNGGPFGIPYVTVGNNTSKVQVTVDDYPDESDMGMFPVPLNAPIE